jgi:transposase
MAARAIPVQEAQAEAVIADSTSAPRRRRSKQERRRIVEETLVAGASVARVARAHGVNANQVFYWRKLYQQGLLDEEARSSALVPVRITDPEPLLPPSRKRRTLAGAIELELARGRVRLEGAVDPLALRVVLECLLG